MKESFYTKKRPTFFTPAFKDTPYIRISPKFSFIILYLHKVLIIHRFLKNYHISIRFVSTIKVILNLSYKTES